jgi:hypothetical protein
LCVVVTPPLRARSRLGCFLPPLQLSAVIDKLSLIALHVFFEVVPSRSFVLLFESLDRALQRVSDGESSSEGVTVVLLHQRRSDDVVKDDALPLSAGW